MAIAAIAEVLMFIDLYSPGYQLWNATQHSIRLVYELHRLAAIVSPVLFFFFFPKFHSTCKKKTKVVLQLATGYLTLELPINNSKIL